MGTDIEAFRKYGKINQYIHRNQDGVATTEKIREIIGTEFSIMDKAAIERHFQNMILANFFHTGTNGMLATKIDWVEFEEKLRQKGKEIAEMEGNSR